MMMRTGSIVTVAYACSWEGDVGVLLDSSEQRTLLTFEVGARTVPAEIDHAVRGMRPLATQRMSKFQLIRC